MFAEHRNRNALGWFLIGLLFGPFGLLVLAFPKIEYGVVTGPPTVEGLIKEKDLSAAGIAIKPNISEG